MTPKREWKQVSIEQIIPPQWKQTPEKARIWLTGYRGHGASRDDIGKTPKIIDLDEINVRVIAFHGRLPYPVVALRTRFDDQDRLQMKRTSLDAMAESEGLHFLFLTPVSNGAPVEVRMVMRPITISCAISLVAAVCGRKAVFQHLFDQELAIGKGRAKGYHGPIESPVALGKPDLTKDRIAQLVKATEAIARLPEHDRNRVIFSLRWYQMAWGEPTTEAFLKYWIALEALCMKTTTNIKPIKEMLSTAYQIPIGDVESRFRVGRLFHLRGRIVHRGEFVPMHISCLRYLEALYQDLLLQFLGFKCERKAEGELTSNRRKLSILFGEDK